MPVPIPQEIQDKILQLREEGLSYAKIAVELGINKKTAIIYCNPEARVKANRAMAEYREKHPDRVAATLKKSYWSDPDKHRAKCRMYYAKNREEQCARAKQRRDRDKERSRAANRASYARHKEKRQEYARQYRASYPDRVRTANKRIYERSKHLFFARNAARRAQRIMATPKWLTKEHHHSINLMYKLRETLQKNTEVEYHVDHIVPLRAKRDGVHVACGLHVPWNLQVIPASKNLKKNCNLDPAFYS